MAGKAQSNKNKVKDLTLDAFGVQMGKVEELEKRMGKMLTSIGEEIKKQLKEQLIQLKEQQEVLIKDLTEKWEKKEEEWRKEKEEWKVEKEDLGSRIKKLEWEKEKLEREKRKLNIVIRGQEFTEDRVEEQVEEFLEANLKVEVKTESAYILKKNKEERKGNLVIAKLQQWEMKKQVMFNKKELRKGVYIDDDLTEKERKIQLEVRKKAREEKGNGKNVKAGYMKVQIDGKWLKWSEMDDCFIEETDRRRRL